MKKEMEVDESIDISQRTIFLGSLQEQRNEPESIHVDQPMSVSFSSGMTGRQRKDSVIKGSLRRHPSF